MDEKILFVIIFSGVWSLLGTIFLIIGIVILKNRKLKEMNCTSKTYGKVTDIVRHRNYDNNGGYSSSWHPVFEYKIGELKYIKESIYGSSSSKFAVGQDVEIYYNPEDYNDYYVATETLSKTLGKIFTGVGIGAIIVAILVAILVIYVV